MLVTVDRENTQARFVMVRDEYKAICEAAGIDKAGVAAMLLHVAESESYIKQKQTGRPWFQMSLERWAERTHGIVGKTQIKEALDALEAAGFIINGGVPDHTYLRATAWQFNTAKVQAAVNEWSAGVIAERRTPKDPPKGPQLAPEQDNQPEPEQKPTVITMEKLREWAAEMDKRRIEQGGKPYPLAATSQCIDSQEQMHLRVCGNPFAAIRQSNIYSTSSINSSRGIADPSAAFRARYGTP